MPPPKPAPANPWEPVIFIVVLLVVLFALWWVRGGPEQARMSGQGLFVSPSSSQNNQTN